MVTKYIDTESKEIYSINSRVKHIIELQIKQWPQVVLDIDCDSLQETKAQEYCHEQTLRMQAVENRISWSDIHNKNMYYILAFDCDNIYEDPWKDVCKKEQNRLQSIQKVHEEQEEKNRIDIIHNPEIYQTMIWSWSEIVK